MSDNNSANAKARDRSRKLVTVVLVGSVITAVLATEHARFTATIVVCVISAVALLFAYYRSDRRRTRSRTSLMPAVVTLEVLFYIWARHAVAAQVITTAAIAAVVALSREPSVDGPPKRWLRGEPLRDAVFTIIKEPRTVLYVDDKVYFYAWLSLRAVVIVAAGTDGWSRAWYTSQLLVVLCILAMAPGTQYRDNARFLTLVLFGTAGLIYASSNAVPWGINIALLAIPVYHVLNTMVPSPYEREPVKADNVLAIASMGVALACVAAAVIWQRRHPSSIPHSEELVCLAAHNLRPLDDSCEDDRRVGAACCCMPNTLRSTAFGCVPTTCYEQLTSAYGIDCCRQSITDENRLTMSGKYMCAYGNVPFS